MLIPIDLEPPLIESSSPANEGYGVGTSSRIALSFTEPIQRGNGAITIRELSGATFALIPVSSTSLVTLSGKTVTISPGAPLAYATSYFVDIPPGAFTDLYGNPFAGLYTYGFTTAAPADTISPTVAITSSKSALKAGESATISFTLSESSTDFLQSDLSVSGGILSNFTGSGTSYSAIFTPTANSTTNGVISVASDKFSDAAGNFNKDGSDANNTVSLAVDTKPPAMPQLWAYQTRWSDNPEVTLATSLGSVTLELYPTQAPVTSANWLAYVQGGFFDGLIFHRVIDGFMVQGGGFIPGLTQKTPSYAAIGLESNNGLSNLRGTVAMARTTSPNSATSQFFINLVDNGLLDYKANVTDGYAVFGSVIEGMSVVDAIGKVNTQTLGGFADVPVQDVLISSANLTHSGVAYSNTGFVVPFGLEQGATWSYSVDGGTNWLGGFVTAEGIPYIQLAEGSYASNNLKFRQIDIAGNQSGLATLAGTLIVDKTAPKIAISGQSAVQVGSHTTISFTLSEASIDFQLTDIVVTGGTLSNFAGSGASYSASFTPAVGATQASISVQNQAFTDASGLFNTDAADADNRLVLTITAPSLEGPSLEGHVYHWKSHHLLEGVSVQAQTFGGDVVSGQTLSEGSFSLSGLATGQNPLVVTKAIGAAESGSVLSAADALAALKIAVGLNPNSDGRTLSPYQLIAADANEDGRVSAADALAILKMAVKRTDAPVRQWLFVSEGEDFWDHTANNGAGGWTVNRGKVDYDRGDKLVTVSEQGSEVNLVGVLKGDVNGSWQAPANSQDLDVISPSYFTSLAARLQVPIEQWG